MRRDADSAEGATLPAACLIGAATLAAGLLAGSPWCARFVAARLSVDGALDPYTVDLLGAFSLALVIAGALIPLISAAAPAFLRWTPPSRASANALAAAGLAATMALYAWLAFIPPYNAAAPRSQSDEIQYTIPAVNAIERGRFVMVINGREYPPYTPLGFQLLLVPFYRIFGTMLGNGIRAVQVCGLLSVAAVYALGAAALGRRRGLLAALLLSTNPALIFWSKGIMPTTANLALTAAALLLLISLWRSEGGGRVAIAAALGVVAGLQLLLSYSTSFVAPALFVLVLAAPWRGRRAAAACSAAFALGAFAAMAPQLVYQYSVFGSPLRSGYLAWIHQAYPPGSPRSEPFQLPFVRIQHDWRLLELAARAGFNARVSNPAAMMLDMAGLGDLYNLAVFLLFAAGCAFLRGRRDAGAAVLLLSTGVLALSHFAGFAGYIYATTRFFIQILPCVLPLCAEGFIAGYRAARGGGGRWARLLLCSLLAFAVSGASGAAWRKAARRDREPCMYEIARAYGEIAGGGGAVVSGICGAYLCHFFPPDAGVKWLPVSIWARFARYEGRLVAPVASEEPRLLHGLLAAGTPVFMDDYYARSFPREYRLVEEGFSTSPVREVCGYRIYRLGEKQPGGGGGGDALRGGQSGDSRYTTGVPGRRKPIRRGAQEPPE
jgi:4-amino-4-deoxy-L-arabinose transferase-like glycosyltransferase